MPEWALGYTNPAPGTHGVGAEFVSLTPTEDGRWRLSGMFDADHGAVLDAALAEMFDRLRQAGDRDVTKTDVLVAMANASLDAAPSQRHDRFRINLFMDPTVSPHASWIDGFTVPDAITALLTCDGTILPTFLENALATSVGRSTRVIPERTRRVVLQRDGRRCANPLCRSKCGLEVHHIRHWTNNGPTDTWNLITLCSRCHRAHHLGMLDLSGNADVLGGVTFADHHGNPIRAGTGTPPPSEPAPVSKQPYQRPLGERLQSDPHLFNSTDPPRNPDHPVARTSEATRGSKGTPAWPTSCFIISVSTPLSQCFVRTCRRRTRPRFRRCGHPGRRAHRRHVADRPDRPDRAPC